MPARIKAPNKIPEWLAVLPKGRMINSKDFADALGIKRAALNCRLGQGLCDFPKPDSTLKRVGRDKKCPTNQWKAVTVRNYIRKLNRESQK